MLTYQQQKPGMTNPQHKDIVEMGGGQYVPGTLGDLVLFNSPATGSTLAVSENDLTSDLVRAKIAESDAIFAAARRRKDAA